MGGPRLVYWVVIVDLLAGECDEPDGAVRRGKLAGSMVRRLYAHKLGVLLSRRSFKAILDQAARLQSIDVLSRLSTMRTSYFNVLALTEGTAGTQA